MTADRRTAEAPFDDADRCPMPGHWEHLHNGDEVVVNGAVCVVLTNDRGSRRVELLTPEGGYAGHAPYDDLR